MKTISATSSMDILKLPVSHILPQLLAHVLRLMCTLGSVLME